MSPTHPRNSKTSEISRPVAASGEDGEASPQPPAAEPPESPGPANTRLDRGEINGRKGPEPTRFGDWEKDGRCIDF
ncbi:MAG TPA: DUF1674 domain-containing protein [Xanthomonadales bacterium]|nr:DUF1674 domain-containing protein [Xanthomonadales bacterium]